MNSYKELLTSNMEKTNKINEQIENDLNAKILKITMKIKDHYPELSQYLEEMPVTVPSENDPEITLNLLRTYYESLNSILNKYKVDYQKIEEQP
jgi:AAA15 family ATPase/GTPase